MNPLDAYFAALPTDHREVMLVARALFTSGPWHLEERYRWRTPTYYHAERYVCYLNHDRRRRGGRSYIGFTRVRDLGHPGLRSEGRKLVRVMDLDPAGDVPVEAIAEVLAASLPGVSGR